MERLNNRAAVVGLLAIGSMVFIPNVTFAQNPNAGSAPVTIVNPLPLPVTGSVNVTNFPEPPAIEHVQFRGIPTSFSGGSGSTTLVVVPAGKRLVIEHASISVNVFEGKQLLSCGLGIAEPSKPFDSMVCHSISSDALNHLYAGNNSTKYIAEPGATVKLFVSTLTSGEGSVSGFVSGYYIPAP